MVGEPEALRPLGNMQRCKGHKLSLNLAFFFAPLREALLGGVDEFEFLDFLIKCGAAYPQQAGSFSFVPIGLV